MSRAPVVVALRADVTPYLTKLLDAQIVAGVDLATHYYRYGQRGRGAYELARLAMRVNRLLDQPEPVLQIEKAL